MFLLAVFSFPKTEYKTAYRTDGSTPEYGERKTRITDEISDNRSDNKMKFQPSAVCVRIRICGFAALSRIYNISIKTDDDSNGENTPRKIRV